MSAIRSAVKDRAEILQNWTERTPNSIQFRKRPINCKESRFFSLTSSLGGIGLTARSAL